MNTADPQQIVFYDNLQVFKSQLVNLFDKKGMGRSTYRDIHL